MNEIEKIKQSLADGGFPVFVEQPKAYDKSPQCNVSLFGLRDDGPRFKRVLVQVQVWTVDDKDDVKLNTGMWNVFNHLCDDINVELDQSYVLASQTIAGATWSGIALVVYLR